MKLYRSYVARSENGELGYSEIEEVEVVDTDLPTKVVLTLAKTKIVSIGIEGDSSRIFTLSTDKHILHVFLAGMNHEYLVRNDWEAFWSTKAVE